MNLRVQREIFSERSSIGRLFVNGDFECYTLEPVWKEDGSKPRAIPDGTYALTFRFSAKHGRNMPHVENVPGFEGIEIHPGNFPTDTEGCLLVGKIFDAHKADYIGNSNPAYYELLAKLTPAWDAKEDVTITYVNFVNPEDSKEVRK